MTYRPHYLLSWGGTLANGADVWANNVRMMNDETLSTDGLDDGQMETLLDDFVADIKGFVTNPQTYISSSVECQWVKFNRIDENGHYSDPTKTHVRFLSGTTGNFARFRGAAGAGVPTFQSVCITTTTARQRGPASKGRLFLPQCAPDISIDGYISDGAATAIATRAAAFFTALGDEAGIDSTAIAPAVVSNVGDPGPMERITGIRVGNVPDVIKRRKNAITEKYFNGTVATA